MQIVFALVVMGVIGAVAVVLIAAAAVIQWLPLLVVVLVVVAAVRWWERRGQRRHAPWPPAPRPAAPRVAPPPGPTLRHPDGWMLVAVWRDPSGGPQPRQVIDAEVISVDEHHG